MPDSAKKIKLKPLDELFTTEESRNDAQREKIVEVPLSKLHPFKNHPFKIRDDERMKEMVESVQKYGVLVPAIIRPGENGEYEMIAGHRRQFASHAAQRDTMPCIIRDLDDDAATIIMVDSNLQRDSILPSERAFAYRMKLEALKHQGLRSDLTSDQLGQKLDARSVVAKDVGASAVQVQRFIRLTNLIQPLLDMVDEKKIAFNPAVELSYLREQEQHHLLETIKSEQATPSLSQAQRLKKFSQDGKLSEDVILAIMSEEKKPEVDRLIFTSDTLKKYFPKSYTPKQMEDTILRLLENWQKHRKQEQSL